MYDNYQTPPTTPFTPPVVSDVPQPPKRGFHFRKFSVPLVAKITSSLSVLLLLAGLLTARELSQTSQDVSPMAQIAPAMDLSIVPATQAMNVSEEKKFDVQINPNGQTATAVKLIVKYDPAFISIPSGVQTSSFPIILDDMNPTTGTVTVVVGAEPTQAVSSTTKVFTFTAKALKAGTTKITIAPESEAAAATFRTNQAKVVSDLTVTIGTAPPTATTICWNRVGGTGENLNWPNSCKGTPTNPTDPVACAAVNTPLTADEKTQYNAWKTAGSVVPAACSDTANTTSPTLNLGFRVQGITIPGISQPTEVTLRYKHKTTGEIIKKIYPPHTFTSVAAEPILSEPAGMLRSRPPMVLTDLNLSEVERLPTSGSFGTGIEVYVKTPTSLRKKLGEIIYENSDSTPVKLKGVFIGDAQKLMVGDFQREGANNNLFDILDIGKMVNKYKTDSVPAIGTSEFAEFDVNYDGVFDILDIGFVVYNYKQDSTIGDTP